MLFPKQETRQHYSTKCYKMYSRGGEEKMGRLLVLLCLLVLYISAFAIQYQLTNNPVSWEDDFPTWSPDGTKIAFESAPGEKYDIYMTSSTPGGIVTKITNDVYKNVEPACSPDGDRIAYVCINGVDKTIKIKNLNTGIETSIREGLCPQWSPDGNDLVFAAYNGETYPSIWKRNLNTGDETQLTDNLSFYTQPDWSEDDLSIVYNKSNYLPTIWIVSSQGGTPSQVSISYGYAPKWSPDCLKIAFYAGNALGGYSIWVYNLTSHELKQATTSGTAYWDVNPDWSPDGSKIAFSRDGNIWITTYGINVEATSLGNIKALYK
jgi:Tol biopolymer transport system component